MISLYSILLIPKLVLQLHVKFILKAKALCKNYMKAGVVWPYKPIGRIAFKYTANRVGITVRKCGRTKKIVLSRRKAT